MIREAQIKSEMKIFAHLKQQKFMRSRAVEKRFLAGRGTAKTHTMGFCLGEAYLTMPRGKVGLAGLTYIQLDSVVIPVIKEAWELQGIYEYNSKTMPFGHYVVQKIPPEHWTKPYKSVGRKAYQYCISFINGFTIQLISQDRGETNRGLNLDGIFIDESATASEDFIYKVLKKAVGRNNTANRLSQSKYYKCHYEFSSAAWHQEGFHIYKHEDLYKEEFKVRSSWTNEQKIEIPPKYLYVEATCLDNPLSGRTYWDEQKAGEDPLVFSVEVANKRMTVLPNGFYHAFNFAKHTYFQANRYEYDDKKELHLNYSNDYREDKPLDVTLDFNADICWSVVLQEIKNEVRTINSNFVKPNLDSANTDIVVQNAEWFCKTYQTHPVKEVYIYGDPNGRYRSASSSDNNKPHFDRYCNILLKHGWKVFRRELTSYPRHKRKYTLINSMLLEDNPNLPVLRFNELNNKVLIMTIQSTAVNSEDYTKDKTPERKLPQARRQYAPDGTDALDYYLWAKFNSRMPDNQNQNNQIYIYRR
jgi:hypothetical protein